MEQILLLTNNILSEETLTKKLECLNYEVLCSSQLMVNIMNKQGDKSFFKYFNYIILSRTISNEDCEYIAEYLNIDEQIIFREGDVLVGENKETKQQKTKFNRWIYTDCSLEELREALSEVRHHSGFYLKNGHFKLNSQLNHLKLTSNERMVIEILTSANGSTVSREEICKKVWNVGMNNSTLSQLSSIVSRINRKFKKNIGNSRLIETVWGRGYHLNGYEGE